MKFHPFAPFALSAIVCAAVLTPTAHAAPGDPATPPPPAEVKSADVKGAGHMFGLQYASDEVMGTYPHVRISRDIAAARPSSLVLTDYLPPVADQGQTASCVGWSSAYYCYSYTVAKERKLTPDEVKAGKYRFSPAFVWHQYNKGNADNGMHIYEAMDIFAKQGCATLDEMPWTESDLTSKPNEAAKADAARFKARQTVLLFRGAPSDIADPEKLKIWLSSTHQPFVLGLQVYDDFMTAKSVDKPYKPDAHASPIGGHAICIIGYDDAKHAFRMVNSWGPQWGDDGFLWIDEDYLCKESHEGWAERPGGPKARSVGRGPAKSVLPPGIVIETSSRTAADADDE